MELMTKEIEDALQKVHSDDEEKGNFNSKVIVKYFNPCGIGTWIIIDGEKIGDDWILYGYCFISSWEWGEVSLNELKRIKLPFDFTIERDILIEPLQYTVNEVKR